MTWMSQPWISLASKRLVLSLVLGLSGGGPVMAGICEPTSAIFPDGFPDQPINIFIPRGRSSGAMRLSAQIADAIRGLTDEAGNPLGIEVNLLSKFGGNSEVALDYFEALPPNGYNVVQLNDTYASLVAQRGNSEPALQPISIAQIAFSQLYIRTDDTRYNDLQSFVSYAAGHGDDLIKVAKFGSNQSDYGLEDILLDRFARSFEQTPEIKETTTEETAGDAGQGEPQPLPFRQVGFESGSARYYSLFDEAVTESQQTDALIEQPGDVARLIDSGLLKPVFTLLPQEKLTPEFESRLGRTTGFNRGDMEGCPMLYRFRGFFVPHDIPPDRRRFLEWVFLEAFDSDAFQAVNRDGYIDLLYPDDSIMNAYCSAPSAREFFNERVRNYATCFKAHEALHPVSEQGAEDG